MADHLKLRDNPATLKLLSSFSEAASWRTSKVLGMLPVPAALPQKACSFASDPFDLLDEFEDPSRIREKVHFVCNKFYLGQM